MLMTFAETKQCSWSQCLAECALSDEIGKCVDGECRCYPRDSSE